MTKYLTEAKARGKARDLNRNLEAHDFTWSAIHYPGHGWLVQEVDAQGDPIA
jgi:esterase/lipase